MSLEDKKSESWKLEPTLVRHFRNRNEGTYKSVIRMHLNNFKYSVRGRTNNLKDIIDDADELWALGQHHGLNTPLLDFTNSPYVSAYFAFHEEKSDSDYRVVYGISQAAIRTKLKSDLELFKPLSDHNKRLLSQGGLFVKFKTEKDIESLLAENYEAEEKKIKLYRIRIPNKDREICLKFLNNMNINHNTLFPDLLGTSIYCNTKLEIKNY